MNLWPVEHFFWAYLSSVLGGFAVAGGTANPPKSDDKYSQKSVQLVRGSSLRYDFLQNPYFNHTSTNYGMFHKQRIFPTFDGRCFWLLLFDKHESMVIA